MKLNIKELAGNVPYYSAVLIRGNGLCYETNFREIELGEQEHLLINRGKGDCIVVNSKGEESTDVRNFSEAFILAKKLLGFKQDEYLKKKASEKIKTFNYSDFNLDSIVPPKAYRVFKSLDGRELNPEHMEMHNYVPVVVSFIGSGYLSTMVFYKVNDKLIIDTDVLSDVPIKMIHGTRKQFSEVISETRAEVLHKIPIKVRDIFIKLNPDSIEDNISCGMKSSVLFNSIRDSITTIANVNFRDYKNEITKTIDNIDKKVFDSYEDIPRSQELEIVLKANQVALTTTKDKEIITVVGIKGETTIDVTDVTDLDILEPIRIKHKQKLKLG